MCNWSESIEERSIKCECLNAIGRMNKANITKEQIISMDIQRMSIQKQRELYPVFKGILDTLYCHGQLSWKDHAKRIFFPAGDIGGVGRETVIDRDIITV